MINIVNTITFKLELTVELETFGILIFQIGNQLLMGSKENMLYLFDLESKSKYIISSLLANKISTVISVIRLDDDTLISASYDGKLQLYLCKKSSVAIAITVILSVTYISLQLPNIIRSLQHKK